MIGGLFVLGAAVLAVGCASRSEPSTKSPQAETEKAKLAPPPPTASASSATPESGPVGSVAAGPPGPPPPPPGQVVVVHQADLHGKVKGRAGKHLTIEPLVATSMTLPAKGNKGSIFREIKQDSGDNDWLLVAEVVVANTMTAGKNVDVDIVDEKKDALLNGQKVNHFAPGTMVRLRWEW
jgi:hypothetical protein